MRALIASGTGRYGDPWHPFAATSAALARTLTASGVDVTVEHDVDRAMTLLDDVDVLVVNAGDPWRGEDAGAVPPQASLDGLRAALERGTGVLALHAAVASLRDHPHWAAAVGAVWVPGASWHPPAGEVRVRLLAEGPGAALVRGLPDFTVHDERYLRLQRVSPVQVLADVEHDGERHPVVWVRRHGAARVAVDLLGHDTRSHEAPGHRALLARLTRWCGGSTAGP
ncbi:ThuA domain-containing protein [Kineococcus sp. SYSU DK002]|uniref:ThuA domain-containing protein n=1 Tax=Kineococcus sp. SYSU DK002 TaxID=3383123 RepID=UPI003D7DD6BE